jgi:hypothetical protein
MLRQCALLACLLVTFVGTRADTPIPSCDSTASSTAVPRPWYSLPTSTDPRNQCGGASCNYGWQETDGTDSPSLQAIHRNMITLTGGASNTAGQFINISASSGPNSIASSSVLDSNYVFSDSVGSLDAGSSGWSFEFTFKMTQIQNYAKIMDFGNDNAGGRCHDDVLFGSRGNTNTTAFDWCETNGAEHQLYPSPQVELNLWYHVVIVVQELSSPTGARTGRAHWYAYFNGVTNFGVDAVTGPMPTGVPRTNKLIGKSDWADNYWSGNLRTFNVYRHALGPAQINALYLGQMGSSCTVNRQDDSTLPAGSGQGGPASNPQPIFQLPSTIPPGNGYSWLVQDPADVPCGLSDVHSHLLVLGGGIANGQYVDLAASTGSNSIGTTMPNIGGDGSGSLANNDAGLSFEVVFKPLIVEHYSKMFDLGNTRTVGSTCNEGEISSGWFADGPTIDFDVCDATGREYKMGAIDSAPMNQWTHVVYVIQKTANGKANYYSYVNGELVSSLPMAYMPTSRSHDHAYMGKSNWASDWYWEGMIDTFNIYDRAISPRGARALYNSHSNNGAAPKYCPVSYNPPSTVDASLRIFSADFATDPSSSTGGIPGYQWALFDSNDTSVNQGLHRGLLYLSGGAGGVTGPYVNLTATSGPNYIGRTFDSSLMGGAATTGNVLVGTAGFAIETVFKATAAPNWAKLFDFSGLRSTSSRCNYDVFFGWHGTQAGAWDFQICDQDGASYGAAPFWTNGQTFQWYHVITNVAMTSSGKANYTIYVNGDLVSVSVNQYYPTNLPRPHAVIGLSEWNDAYWQGYLDTFNIYSTSLNPSQARTLYQSAMLTPATVTLPTCSDAASAVAIPKPWFDFGFDSDPRPTTPGAENGAANYGFVTVDPSDPANVQNVHSGLLVLSGSPSSAQGGYINLTASTGPDSVGVTIPMNGPQANIGGSGDSSNLAANGNAGWTFETTFKPTSQQAWAKLWDLANPQVDGVCRDDLLLGWRDTSNTLTFTVCDNTGAQTTIYSDVNLVLNTWYHVVIVIQQLADTASTGSQVARYTMYINGVVPAGTAHSIIGPLPRRTFRRNADLGKSSWNDGYFAAYVDSFNIFDSSLNSAQINALYLKRMGGCSASIQTGTTRPSFNGDRIPSGTSTASLTPFWALPTDSAPSNGNGAAVVWEQNDPEDVFCGLDQYHTGLFNLAGSMPGEVGPYINVAQASGPNSVGSAMPTIGGTGAGSVSDGSAGWTFEFSVKARSVEQWSKLMDFSQEHTTDGHCHNDIVTGFYDASPFWSFSTCNADNVEYKINDAFGSSTIDVWMHGVMVIQANADGTANYFTYRDGKLYNALLNAYLPQAVARPNGFLGRSAWQADQYWDGLIDLFNVYQYAASTSQVLALFNSRSNNGLAPVACDSNQGNVPDVISSRSAILDLTFDVDPRPSAGGASAANFGWVAVDANDTASNQALHKNLLSLDGLSQYVNLTATSGATYMGQTFNPSRIGRGTTGSAYLGTAGWTIELTYKATARKTYSKVFDFGSGAPRYNILYGELADRESEYTFQLFDRNNNDQGSTGTVPALTGMSLFNWYHVVFVIQQTRTNTANYYIYVNGVQRWSRTEAWYIESLPRMNAFIGKSAWNDALWQGFIDTFRIYSVAATPTQVLNLYRVEEGQDVTSSSSKLSGGAIAGAVIGSIVGAVLLCLIVFCVCCKGKSSSFSRKKDMSLDTGSGRFGEMHDNDVEMSQAPGEEGTADE